ncbi:MAG: tRNA epoxyqueuosine(34) reductase QueG, partial [Planctomycetes bacterium]|nr:tRNA epoxyqueuosine(34) reductase QueG [Planctomycetota bacterium]
LLQKLVSFIAKQLDDSTHRYKICVDSVPLAERSLAKRSGIGFIGKNHMLINPVLGSQLLLAEIVTTVKLTPDKPLKTSCKNCSKCIEACPTGALRPDGAFDASKCISYLAIEHKNAIPQELAPLIGTSMFGCDRCILACPYEKTAALSKCTNSNFTFYPERIDLDPAEVIKGTEHDFEQIFDDSSVKRLGLDRLKRNAAICLKNAADQNEK